VQNYEVYDMMLPYTYRELSEPLQGREEARKLALMARQVKIEQALLGEMMFNGWRRFKDQFDFYLEDNRRDLTVTSRAKGELVIGSKRKYAIRTASRVS
jgi:hypothetical protein